MRIYRAAAIARTRWLRPSVCVVRGLGCSVTCIPTFAMIPERASSIAWRCAACSATSADTALPRDCRERRDCEDAAVPRDCRERRDFGEWRELCAEPTLRGALATLERQERSYVLLLQWTVLAATGRCIEHTVAKRCTVADVLHPEGHADR